jgi:hypothetical protein
LESIRLHCASHLSLLLNMDRLPMNEMVEEDSEERVAWA